MTTVSRTLYGTGDSHVASSLTVSQCQEVSQSSAPRVGTKVVACMLSRTSRTILGVKGLSAKAQGLFWDPPITSHGTVPSSNASHFSVSMRCRILASDLSQLFQVTDFHNPLLSALKVNSVSMATTRSLYNFECMFSKRVTKILSLEG